MKTLGGILLGLLLLATARPAHGYSGGWGHRMSETSAVLWDLRDGKSLLEGKETRRLEGHFGQIQDLVFAPDDPEIHLNAALLAFYGPAGGHRAEWHLREALRLRPDYTEAFSALATLLAQQGRWAEAEAAWREVLTRDPGNREARQGLAARAR